MIQSYMYTSVTSKHKPYLIPFRVLFQEKKNLFYPIVYSKQSAGTAEEVLS